MITVFVVNYNGVFCRVLILIRFEMEKKEADNSRSSASVCEILRYQTPVYVNLSCI